LGITVFYGVTRYSLFSPGSPSWKTSRNGVFKTPEDYMAYLFSEKRLKLRAELFLGKSVPVLAVMAEQYDYKHFVLYSGLLPAPHKELLFDAAAKYPFLIPVELNDMVRGTGLEEVMPLIEEDLAGKCSADDGVQPVVWFRLDDDDILAADYLTCLEPYRTLNHLGMVISFGLGLTAYRGGHELINLREYHHPKSAQGMAFVAGFDPATGRLGFTAPGPHTDVDRVMPTILDSREHMYFQIRHGDQDSSLKASLSARVATSLARLDRMPAIRAAEISAAKWPTVIDDLVRGESAEFVPSTSGGDPFLLTADTILTFPLEAEAGLVQFEFEYESAEKLGGVFAVVSYDLLDADGLDVTTLGLKKSPKFGVSRHAWSRRTRGVVRQSVLLPEGVGISSLTLIGKNKQAADVFIRMRKPRVVDVYDVG
jgi:hypothetical protein